MLHLDFMEVFMEKDLLEINKDNQVYFEQIL